MGLDAYHVLANRITNSNIDSCCHHKYLKSYYRIRLVGDESYETQIYFLDDLHMFLGHVYLRNLVFSPYLKPFGKEKLLLLYGPLLIFFINSEINYYITHKVRIAPALYILYPPEMEMPSLCTNRSKSK